MSSAINPNSVSQHHFSLGTGSLDAGNKYEKYFGPPIGEVKPSPYDKIPYTNYDLPEYYKGKNLFLRDTIDGLIMDASDRWYTTVALPWAQTDQLHLIWNEWHFNTSLVGRVPHEGISRLVTSSKKQFRDHVVRHGIAFIMEADLFGTPEGDEQYRRNVKGIVRSVQETQDHDTVFALLSAKNYFKMWEDKFGRLGITYQKILETEIENYASIVRDERRLYILVEKHQRLMRKNGADPDLIILPPESKIYLSMEQGNDRIEYTTAGPGGPTLFKNGPRALATLRDNIRVFETRDFTVYDDVPPIDLLTRAVNISEYYPMIFKDWRNDDISNYQTKWRDTYLYDENKDDFNKITFKDAFLNAKIFGKDGDYHGKLKELIQRYKTERRGQHYRNVFSNDDGDDMTDDSWHKMKMDKDSYPPPFFLSAPDNDNEYFLIKYFGQMDLTSACPKDFEQIGQTIVARIFSDQSLLGTSAEMETWQDMIRLIREIETQTYDREYWLAVIEANEPFSINDKGNFVGELTPRDLVKHWDMKTNIKEWKPNSMGSLILPTDKKSLNGVVYPAGFANAPGFQTLAREANNSNSHWYDIGKRAADSLDLLNRMVTSLQKYLPTSEALKAKNRSPWFHRPDALTVFFENLVTIPRDPIWIAALPPVMADPTNPNKRHVRGKTFGGMEVEVKDKISWFPVPLFIVSSNSLKRDDDETNEHYAKKIGVFLKKIYGGILPDNIEALDRSSPATGENRRTVFIYKSIVTGGIREIPQEYLYHTSMIPREIKVYMLMGTESVNSLNDIFNIINKVKAYDDIDFKESDKIKREIKMRERMKELKNKMLNFMMNYMNTNGTSKVNLKKIVRAMATDIATPIVLFGTIDTIYITSDSSGEDKKKALKRINTLISIMGVKIRNDDPDLFVLDPKAKEDNPDIFVLDPETPLQPPGFKNVDQGQPINPIDQLGYSEIRESMESIFDLVADINAIIITIEPNNPISDTAFSMILNQQGLNRWFEAADLPDKGAVKGAVYDELSRSYAKKMAHLRKLLGEINQKVKKLVPDIDIEGFDAKKDWGEEANERFQEKKKFSVQDAEGAVFRSKFYRSPLTASLSLLESLSREGPTSLIRPSDPRTSHTSAYVEEEEGSQGRTLFLPEEIWKRPQYADISSIHHDREVKEIQHLTFISRHIKSNAFEQDQNQDEDEYDGEDDFSDADMYRGPTATATATTTSTSNKRTAFNDFGDDDDDDDDDDEERDEDALSRVFGEVGSSSFKSKMRKTSHTGRFNIGGKFQSHLKKGKKLTKKDLKKGHHGGQYAFSQSGFQYSEKYGKIRTGTFAQRWKQSNDIADPFIRLFVQCFILSRSDRFQWLRLIDNDIHVPCNIILWRNFIEHDMASAILMKGGLETGANLYGHSNFATGNDVVSKMIYGNYTFYSKAIVWKERNLHIIENIKPVQYRGGNNTKFTIRRKDLDDQDRSRSSIIATAIPITENDQPFVMSFTGKLEIPDINDLIDGKTPTSYSTWEYYDDEVWQIGQSIKNDDMGRDSFFDRQDRINVHALQGLQANYNRASRQYDKWIDAKGHRGRNGSYPGAARVWNGQGFLKEYDFSQKKLD